MCKNNYQSNNYWSNLLESQKGGVRTKLYILYIAEIISNLMKNTSPRKLNKHPSGNHKKCPRALPSDRMAPAVQETPAE